VGSVPTLRPPRPQGLQREWKTSGRIQCGVRRSARNSGTSADPAADPTNSQLTRMTERTVLPESKAPRQTPTSSLREPKAQGKWGTGGLDAENGSFSIVVAITWPLHHSSPPPLLPQIPQHFFGEQASTAAPGADHGTPSLSPLRELVRAASPGRWCPGLGRRLRDLCR
jgi:hypothetical protein